MILACFN